MDYKTIKTKAVLGLPLTERERAIYLLFIASKSEAAAFLNAERKKEAE